MKRYLILMLVLFFIIPMFPHSQASASTISTEPTVQVKLVNYLGNLTQLSLRMKGDYLIDSSNLRLEDGKTYIVRIENGELALFDGSLRLNIPTPLSIIPTSYSNSIDINNRLYHGKFRFIIENGYIRPINTLLMEDYLKGVVPHEMYSSWNTEALKVQAIAARTYAMTNVSRVIDDTVSNQVYGGYQWYSNSTAAVNETTGEILTFNGIPLGTAAVYSASNGGKTESNSNAWGSTGLSYLSIREDHFDPKTSWKLTLNKQQIDPTKLDLKNSNSWWSSVKEADMAISTTIKKWLNQNGYQGKDLKIVSVPKLTLHTITSGGRVSKGDMTVEFFSKDKVDVSGNLELQRLVLTNRPAATIRAMVGLGTMSSYLIQAQTETVDSISITGSGNGHGVGMSQWGAKQRADAGHSYQSIVSFYYPGTVIMKRYDLATREIDVVPVTTQSATVPPVTVSPKPETKPIAPKPVPIQVTKPVPTIQKSTKPVDKTPPAVKSLKSTIDYKKNNTVISFTINEDAKVTVKLLNSKGKVVSTLASNQAVKKGTHKKNLNISKIANGNYTVTVVSVDKNKNQSTTRTTVKINKPKVGTITASKLNVRATGSTKGKVIGTVKRNQKVTIVATTGSWHKIKSGKGYGYVHKSYIK